MKRFKIDLTFIITIIVSLLSPYKNEIILLFIALLIHELGHLFFVKIFKIKINKLSLTALGFFLEFDDNTISFFKELLIYLGGIIFNIITIFLFDFLDYYSYLIIVINILPIFPLDGFRVIKSLISYLIFYKFALYISQIISLLACIIIYFSLISSMDNLFFINYLYLIILNVKELYNVNAIYNSFLLNRFLYKKRYKKRRVSFRVKNEQYLYRYHNIYILLDNYMIEEDEILRLKYNYL